MKNRISFLVITSKSGVRKKISVGKNLLLCIIFLGVFLFFSGLFGAWKYRENLTLKKQLLQLEAEKAQMEAINRTVENIKDEEVVIRKLLGLDSEPTGEENP